MGTSASRGGDNAPKGAAWSNAKRQVTSFTRGSGATASSAIGAFVAATQEAKKGGGGRARGKTNRLSSAVSPGQALGSFLSGIATHGLDETLRSHGLEHLIGASSPNVISGIIDNICEQDGVLDDAIARAATVEVLAEIFDESDDAYSNLREQWDSDLDKNRVVELITLFLSQAIFQRFLADLGDKIESNAMSAAHAEQCEQEALEFIKEMVKFEIGEIDPLKFNWKGAAGERLIQRNLVAALSQLED